MNDTELTEDERDIMLTRCGCGHTINDHGSLGHCWTCLDDEREDCPHDFEDLLCERVARIVAARVAAARADTLAPVRALADEWEGWARGRSTPRIDAFRDAAEQLRAAVADPEPQEGANTCPSCALGRHDLCTGGIAPCDCDHQETK